MITIAAMGQEPKTGPQAAPSSMADWRAMVAPYQHPDVRRSLWQVVTTLAPLAIAFVLMYLSLAWSYWLTLVLMVPTAGLLVRTFIIMHDCAHGSFVPSRRINDLLGYLTGVITLTPFHEWQHEHAIHHATAGDLDRRGHGDINTLTVREYRALSFWGRLGYRLYRNPAVLLGFGPIYLILGQRWPGRQTRWESPQFVSVWITNLGIIAGIVLFGWLIGLKALALIYAPTIYLAGIAGVWLFYVQHQFDEAYWQPHPRWDYVKAAIAGCSYLKMPRILQWFTGNIGLHHVHHLAPRIPNYRLQRAHDENPIFHDVPVITLSRITPLLFLALWDETQGRMVGFRELRAN